VREKQLAALARFDAVEEAASQADRAAYLYLRGRLLNAGPDFSAEAESLLSRCHPLSSFFVNDGLVVVFG
jgi:hypothetical protein